MKNRNKGEQRDIRFRIDDYNEKTKNSKQLKIQGLDDENFLMFFFFYFSIICIS